MAETERGVWTLPIADSCRGQYYKFRVTVYCPWTQKVEVSETSDPYSVSLAADGDRSQVGG